MSAPLKPKLAVGDRIKFIGPASLNGSKGGCTIYCSHFDAEVTAGESDAGLVRIDVISSYDGGRTDATIHRRQVVSRIKRKPKPEGERHERWLNLYSDHQAADTFFSETSAKLIIQRCANYRGTVHLVEQRPGELIVDELKLGTAMDNCGDTVFVGVGNALMKQLMIELRKLP